MSDPDHFRPANVARPMRSLIESWRRNEIVSRPPESPEQRATREDDARATAAFDASEARRMVEAHLSHLETMRAAAKLAMN